MGYLPYLAEKNRNILTTDSFGGLNKSFRIAENELSDSYNMTSDDAPVLSVRKKRAVLRYLDENGVPKIPEVSGGVSDMAIINDSVAVLTLNGTLYYQEQVVSLGVEKNKMLRFGSSLFCYPSGVLVTIHRKENEDDEIIVERTAKAVELLSEDDTEKEGTVGVFRFLPSCEDAIGKNYSIAFPPMVTPSDPQIGDYAYFATGDSTGLKRYNGSDWESVQATLIRVAAEYVVPDSDNVIETLYLGDKFKMNDVIFFSGDSSNKLNSSFHVAYAHETDDPCIYLSGVIDSMVETSGKMEKKMPAIDYAVEHNGRVWACRYGENTDGEFVNEIYASALNDPTNWFRYNGTSQDSYAVSITSEGEFTGAAVIGGYVTFFKEDCYYRIYGSYPSDFQLFTQPCIGIQNGSADSLAICNGVAYYKSSVGIMQMADSFPVLISLDLGTDIYSDAIGGTDGYKYYVSMSDGDKRLLYVFDLRNHVWHTENSPDNLIRMIRYRNSILYACAGYTESAKEVIDEKRKEYEEASGFNKLAKYLELLELFLTSDYDVNLVMPYGTKIRKPNLPALTSGDSVLVSEDDVKWHFETGDIGYSYYDKKYLDKITARLWLSPYARADIAVLYDSDGLWKDAGTITGSGSVKVYNVPIRPERCDHFRLRFSGIGDVKLLNLVQFFADGSEL